MRLLQSLAESALPFSLKKTCEHRPPHPFLALIPNPLSSRVIPCPPECLGNRTNVAESFCGCAHVTTWSNSTEPGARLPEDSPCKPAPQSLCNALGIRSTVNLIRQHLPVTYVQEPTFAASSNAHNLFWYSHLQYWLHTCLPQKICEHRPLATLDADTAKFACWCLESSEHRPS